MLKRLLTFIVVFLFASPACAQECFPGPCNVENLGGAACGGGLCQGLPLAIATNRASFLYWNDFLDYTDFATGTFASNIRAWTIDDIGTSDTATATLIGTGPFGELQLDPGASVAEGIQVIHNGNAPETVAPTFINIVDGQTFAWEARIKISNSSTLDFMFGLIPEDVTAFSAGGANTVTDGLYCIMADGGLVTCTGERGDNEVDSTATIQLFSAYKRIGMRCVAIDISDKTDAGSCDVYVDGVIVDTLVDNTEGAIPNTGLLPMFAVVNDDLNTTGTVTVDYIWVSATR